jgi:cellobiose phosphorylase
MRLMHQCFLGLHRENSMLRIDPVIPAALDGLQAEIELADRKVRIIYRIGDAGYGPTAVTLNGQELSLTREVNPYRTGGVAVPMAEVRDRLTVGTNALLVWLG